MVAVRRIAGLACLAAMALGLSDCSSSFLAQIKDQVAQVEAIKVADAAAAAAAVIRNRTFTFSDQFGNPAPQYTFNTTLVVKVDTAGFVYTTDRSFRINKYNSSGTLQKTIDIVSGGGFGSGVNDMTFDAAGNMYVTTTTNTVQKYSVGGSLLFQFGSAGSGNGQFSSPQGIAIDSSGNIYVADSGNNRIQKFDSTGAYLDQWTGLGKNGTGSVFSSPYGMVISGSTLYVVDYSSHQVKLYSTAGNWIVTYGTTSGSSSGQFSYPKGIAKDASGNFYIADNGNNRIQEFNSSFVYITQWNSSFASPNSVAADATTPNANIYVTDGSGNRGRIQKFNPPGTLVSTWGGDDRSPTGYVSMPTGVTYDSLGNIFVIDNLNNRVQKFSSSGSYLQSFAGFSFSSYPLGMAADKSGNVYVPDTGNNQVKKIDSSGAVTPIITVGIGDGSVQSPSAVAVDSAGLIYVIDLNDGRLQVFDSNGYWQSRKIAYAGHGPLGMAVDASGNIFVSAYLDNHLDKLAPDGTLLSQWGSAGNADGQFSVPIGVAIDADGYIFVVDMLNRRVQRFDSTGAVVGKFGSVGMGSGGFGWPVGIGINSAGKILISDYMGCLIQEFTPNQ